jgi:hypothetical protein
LWLIAGQTVDGNAFDSVAGAMRTSVKEFADLRMCRKALAQAGEESPGEQIDPELKIRVQTGGIEILPVAGKEVSPQSRIGPPLFRARRGLVEK